MIVATDRISAYDVVMPNGIPDKGRILTQISAFWFDLLTDVTPNHLISASMKDLPGRCHQLTENLDGLFAVDLVHPNRLVFAPDHDPVPELSGGGVDWSKVTKIEVAGIGDYH